MNDDHWLFDRFYAGIAAVRPLIISPGLTTDRLPVVEFADFQSVTAFWDLRIIYFFIGRVARCPSRTFDRCPGSSVLSVVWILF